ncbi:dipeptidyl-peptidase III putativemetallo-peptidase Clan M- Family M49 [Leptomonas pyrrhocoris]|uniref:Dipeptidyl peptidase 3 n=1 Tax=Leptomonas pyrrhocoris TaxID=157538 RepID=A0A0M9FPK0_LEPPY|nr:dipeptidyl-peptidase III putativemetallo-peptidase Clan M- Family M49 [Leptomonas pyrrhocoris]XP_015651802.1 dipeptidyl-peptidase III putativemetallo-peptidase Clan M- Family M49 [Leptomonas pyrrhocoris]KPA73362.1 dipeptidyl-peptidase III putativemetallo-peptidase Clan M- Family M49 [Leptomonas pyrrhocoris]KPA73363.1 dipeptidyl-peptidase III putativemetallo-peptidase Clan M- Family M49 [Leptomonas pyrrhocoris]|eukprot:XP_015651801.1 dipeptidyl-peptidase III putativemetallo-peptidase Clan M- Family M49 [Leptomonas pyrrhocoris]
MSQKSLYVTPRAVPYCTLAIANAFKDLTSKQRHYAHHMMMAGWCGAPVVAQQLSPESLPLLRFFYKFLSAQPLEALRANTASAGVAAEAVEQFLEYFALVYSNMGNYMSFGDSKFIPAVPKETFAKIVASADAAATMDAALLDAIYDLHESKLTLDFPPKGSTRYYSPNITREDALVANEFLASKKIDGVNTRVFKEDDGTLVIRVAAAEEKTVPAVTFNGRAVAMHFGDFKEEMARVVGELRQARAYAENDIEVRMLDHYIEHFLHGDVDAHKASQKEWVKDVGPTVETNLGFIESYRDPSGVRAEWEGFVAVVNKEQSKMYGALVAQAEKFIAQLPWGAAFEKDVFTSPDFTSLDVLGFASSGIPAGINIPNYDDIRQNVGFKNVYLSNVVGAITFKEKVNHITDADWEVYKTSVLAATSVNVGIHELLGHGTGKLLTEDDDGRLNFDKNTIDPISGHPVTSWYKPGDTYSSVFGGMASSYEECRAEAVSLYLCLQPALLEIFHLTTAQEQQDAIYICWLNMVRAGLCGLEFYTPETQQWRQAHMRARFCILEALARAPNPIVHITEDEKDGLLITLDRERIATDGRKAIGDLLVNLNVNKSAANATRGGEYYRDMTTVNDTYVRYREIVMARRKPRKQYVQPHTRIVADSVEVEEFAGSVEGVVKSFLTRHSAVPL